MKEYLRAVVPLERELRDAVLKRRTTPSPEMQRRISASIADACGLIRLLRTRETHERTGRWRTYEPQIHPVIRQQVERAKEIDGE